MAPRDPAAKGGIIGNDVLVLAEVPHGPAAGPMALIIAHEIFHMHLCGGARGRVGPRGGRGKLCMVMFVFWGWGPAGSHGGGPDS